MNKPIFPKNWEEKKRKLQFWKKPEIQKCICPKCHWYIQRFPHDKVCQFCGYDARPKPKPFDVKAFAENKTNQMEQMFMQKSKREDREFFIYSIIKEIQKQG